MKTKNKLIIIWENMFKNIHFAEREKGFRTNYMDSIGNGPLWARPSQLFRWYNYDSTRRCSLIGPISLSKRGELWKGMDHCQTLWWWGLPSLFSTCLACLCMHPFNLSLFLIKLEQYLVTIYKSWTHKIMSCPSFGGSWEF